MSTPFGTVFGDNMAIAWYEDGAWSAPEIKATEPFNLHPAAHVLHYSSTCFEGMKAYRWEDDRVHLFRPDRHVARMQQSARILHLPVPDSALLQSMITELVADSRDIVPALPGALYVRPVLIGTNANIGAAGQPPSEACLYVLVSPVGDYFRGGDRPLRVLVDDKHMRSAPHFGMAKTGGNYASALGLIAEAREGHRVDQVLFCPGGDVQETGASNFLLLDDERILTKQLDASILHGVTRDSLLRLAAELGYRVEERELQVEELLQHIQKGEAALSGTAAVLAGVGTLVYQGKEHTVGAGEVGPNTLRLRKALADIQSGRATDSFSWLREV